jgi:hypothetical protein
MRNLGKKKFRKSICLRQALSTSLRAPPHWKWTWRRNS